MEMRKWISNDSTLMNHWVAEGFDTYPVDTSACLGSNKTKVLGMAWQTQDDCFTLDTTDLLEFITASEITKRSLLQAIAKIFDPLGSHRKWKQFVKNRVQEITELTNPNTWFHCPGKDNSSDFLSRGLSAKSLIQPDEEDYLPEFKSENSNIVLTLNSNNTFFDYLVNRINRFLTLVRILSYLLRFMPNCRNQEKKKGPLTSEELSEAENYLLKQCQLEEFSAEVISLMSLNEISNKSKISN
ncbi:hypothetical protein HNY73_007930 [Argiope bruennichi]|uniref:Uncharacterized protein n=1 Tax=Argiope bruennichi TaxID=94029 RepID=A0A8T0F4M9_ARGBR|nr:hypothetical protein HNY73_007930 [Argiope bruennichi]